MMNDTLMICTDLDRTLIPNGHQPESPGARDRFTRLAADAAVTLVYVSGRDEGLLRDAIDAYHLPVPDFAIGDVGTTIYRVEPATGEYRWTPWGEWYEEMAPDWAGHDRGFLANLLADIAGLELQEPAKQNTFKLSYYAPVDIESDRLVTAIHRRLDEQGIRASVIWSIDEMRGVGLIDVLPQSATKLHAIRFLQSRLDVTDASTIFAGDSGNDLPALVSPLPAVLVANAREDVRQAAVLGARANGTIDRLYLARGGFLGMNGNYAAGILEGVAHFHPWVRDRIGSGDPVGMFGDDPG